MRLLLIDACGAAATLALAELPRGVFAQHALVERSAAAALLPAVREMLAEAQVGLPDLDAIAVVTGPGSFTGVRIGVSAAKGLSEGAGVPLIAISRLAVLALLAKDSRVHAVLDAGRGEFYLGTYEAMRCVREAMVTHAELLAAVADAPGTVCVCEARVADALRALEPVIVAEPTAADAHGLAAAAFEAKSFADAALLDGNYLRRADAEMLERQKIAMAKAR